MLKNAMRIPNEELIVVTIMLIASKFGIGAYDIIREHEKWKAAQPAIEAEELLTKKAANAENN